MKPKTLKNIIPEWLDKRLVSPNDTLEIQALKTRFAKFLISGIPFLLTTGVLFWLFKLKYMALAMFLFTLFEIAIATIYIFISQNVKLFALINQYFYVLFSFAAVLCFGGIINSGGVVLIGLAGVLHSLYFLKPKQIRILFIVYIASVILEAFLQPFLTQLPEITAKANLILFVIHLFVVAIVLLNWLSFFIQQSLQLENQEVKHQKELMSIRTDFYTKITHEFRTPLTIILGITNPSTNIQNSDFQKNNSLIHKNGIRLLHLVDKILDLSKFEAKSMQLRLIQSDILIYIRQIIEPFQYLAKGKNIKLHIRSELKELQMDFDPEKIDSLISNLLSNSIKYSPNNTDIQIILTKVSSYNSQALGHAIIPDKNTSNKHFLKLIIKDSGYGIKESEIPLIFNRFYQIKTNTEKHGGGTGIGLLLVKEIVKLLDGNLFVKSKSGEGTEITTILPITNKSKVSAAIPSNIYSDYNFMTENIAQKKYSRNKIKLPLLMIIEDNEDVLMYIQSITENHYNVIDAKNGKRGIELAIKKIPDIIISDVIMPGKNGFEVCDALKKDFRTSHIPIVLLSARADKTSQIEGYIHHADAYITKPFEPKELLVRLQKLIEIRKSLIKKYKALALAPDSIPENTQSQDEIFLIKTKEIVDSYFGNDSFDAVELSRQLGMSRSQLFRKLKALTGLSASQYIRFYRLSHAKELAIKTSLSFSEIAYEVGFKDPAYFSRIFTSEFGSPPSSFRNKL